MTRSQHTSSRQTGSLKLYKMPFTSHNIPRTFSFNAPILPVASNTYHIPTAPQTVKVERSLGQTIKEGFGFGIGSSIANRLFGPSPVIHRTVQETTLENKTTIPNDVENKIKASHEDCLRDFYDQRKKLYESCMITKSHEECHKFSPFLDTDHSEKFEEKTSYSKCMDNMYLECKKNNSSEYCQKYKL